MSESKHALKGIIQVASSRGISLLASVAGGLFLPKILGVVNYGYLRIYTLYLTYMALLHFGFADGILLKLAGGSYEGLDKKRIRTYTCFFALFQLIIGTGICLFSSFLKDAEYRFIFMMLGINMVMMNLTTYYQFISQATQRFSEYSARNIQIAVLKSVFIIFLLFAKYLHRFDVSHRLYIAGLNIIDGVLLLWYLITYREITFGARDKILDCAGELREIFHQGFMLTVAYQVANLVFALDRQFVSMWYSTSIYSVYSFAYNIVSMVSTIISSVAVVALPMLKKVRKEAVGQYYPTAMRLAGVISAAALVGYFPIQAFVEWYLPDYVDSLRFLKIVLPSLMLTACISVVMFTFYKVLNQNKIYLTTGCFALVIGIVLNMITQRLFHNPTVLSYASVVTLLLWYLMANSYFVHRFHVRWIRSLGYILLNITVFYLIVSFDRSWIAEMIMYVLSLCLSTVLCYRKYVLAIWKRMWNGFR